MRRTKKKACLYCHQFSFSSAFCLGTLEVGGVAGVVADSRSWKQLVPDIFTSFQLRNSDLRLSNILSLRIVGSQHSHQCLKTNDNQLETHMLSESSIYIAQKSKLTKRRPASCLCTGVQTSLLLATGHGNIL